MAQRVVLLVDHDREFRIQLASALEGTGYSTVEASDRTTALSVVARRAVSLVVTEVLLSRDDGMRLARELTYEHNVPVVFLTSQDHSDQRLAGLALGAEDYIAKSRSLAEIIARVNVVMRRQHDVNGVWRAGNIVLDDRSRTVTCGGRQVQFTVSEYRLLRMLMQNQGRVLSKRQILFELWGDPHYSENVVERHVSRIRRKIDANHDSPRIDTVRGFGYTLSMTRYPVRERQHWSAGRQPHVRYDD